MDVEKLTQEKCEFASTWQAIGRGRGWGGGMGLGKDGMDGHDGGG